MQNPQNPELTAQSSPDGDLVLDQVTGGWITRAAFHERIRHMQEEVAMYAKPGASGVDELIQERREEARRFWKTQS